MIYQNIPAELRALPQWVGANAKKIPINPNNGYEASPVDPATWGTFDAALACGQPLIGFVLSAQDPYCIIDLDNPAVIKVNGETMLNPDYAQVDRIAARHRAILEAFNTYAETSQSGTGVHIVCRATTVKGVKREKVELYSSARYMIFTGNVIKNLPITDQQFLVSRLFNEMNVDAQQAVELEDVTGTQTDSEVYAMAASAANADKFLQLWQGNWQGNPEWPSQSEADFALLAMLAFYTLDNEQVRRMFRTSGLARKKTNRTNYHLNHALSYLRAKVPAAIDLSKLGISPGSNFATPALPMMENIADAQETPFVKWSPPAEQQEITLKTWTPPAIVEENEIATLPGFDVPPGFIGELAEHFYNSSVRPVRTISLVAAIAAVAGIAGRAFNISGTGLNQYMVLIANTGTGKDALGTVINSAFSAIRPNCPLVDDFMGPAAFASGQGLLRRLDKSPCFVSVLGEIGLTMQNLCAPTANAADVMLKKMLLDIYARSGHHQTLQGTAYSDADKNTKAVTAPCVTILGESSPEVFYNGLDTMAIAQGLIPRFAVFEYTGPRPGSNSNANCPMPPALAQKLKDLASIALTAQQNRTVTHLQMDGDALGLLGLGGSFDIMADDKINSTENELTKQLWNRAHLKALKMAGIIAVGVNPYAPLITQPIAEWAIDLISQDVANMQNKFESGAIGGGDMRLELELRKAVTDFLGMTRVQRLTYETPSKMADFQLVPYGYLRRRLRPLNAFKNDRRGSNRALDDALNSAVSAGVLIRLPPAQAKMYDSSAAIFMQGQHW